MDCLLLCRLLVRQRKGDDAAGRSRHAVAAAADRPVSWEDKTRRKRLDAVRSAVRKRRLFSHAGIAKRADCLVYNGRLFVRHAGTGAIFHVSPDFLVYVGQYILKGDIIAIVGPKNVYNVPNNPYKDSNGNPTNGATTGPHLHFAIKKDGKAVNPLDFF